MLFFLFSLSLPWSLMRNQSEHERQIKLDHQPLVMKMSLRFADLRKQRKSSLPSPEFGSLLFHSL